MGRGSLALLLAFAGAASAAGYNFNLNPLIGFYRTKLSPSVWFSPRAKDESVLSNEVENTGEHMRACYFTNWAQYRQGKGKYMPSSYQPGLCTHILFAFGWMNEDFTLRAFDPADVDSSWAKGMYNQVNELKLTDPNLKTLLSVGGWTFGTRLFKAMAKTKASRKVFIDSALAFVRQHKFDGFDIDWEYPAGPEDKENYSLLIKECREAFEEEGKRLNRPRLLLSAAVSAGEATVKNAYNIREIAPYFDFILLMSYDFHGAWESGTGMNSPLFPREGEIFWQQVWNVDWAADYWHKEGMPKSKIIIGIPTYGRGWTLKDPSKSKGLGAETSGPAKSTKYVREAGVASYYEFCEMLQDGAERVWDPEHQVPYLVYGDQWFSYDDAQSIRNKMSWLKEKGYGGAFVWTLDFDDFSGSCGEGKYPLISVIRDELAGSKPGVSGTSKPQGTTTMGPEKTTSRAFKASSTTEMTTEMTTEGPLMTTEEPMDMCSGKWNGFHEYPSKNCGKFLLCVDGDSYMMSCPMGLEYDEGQGYCRMLEDSLCYSTTTTPAPTTAGGEGPFKCPDQGFFPHRYCCSKFHRCIRIGGGENALLKQYLFSCPSPLHFDAKMRVCVHPTASDCIQEESKTEECMP